MWTNIMYNFSNPEKSSKIDEWYRNNGYGGMKMENKTRKLEDGEKYLSIQINIGGQVFHFAGFKNKEKKNPKEPDYKGNNLAVWITTKKTKDKVTEEFV